MVVILDSTPLSHSIFPIFSYKLLYLLSTSCGKLDSNPTNWTLLLYPEVDKSVFAVFFQFYPIRRRNRCKVRNCFELFWVRTLINLFSHVSQPRYTCKLACYQLREQYIPFTWLGCGDTVTFIDLRRLYSHNTVFWFSLQILISNSHSQQESDATVTKQGLYVFTPLVFHQRGGKILWSVWSDVSDRKSELCIQQTKPTQDEEMRETTLVFTLLPLSYLLVVLYFKSGWILGLNKLLCSCISFVSEVGREMSQL